jgi:hypothetical protein
MPAEPLDPPESHPSCSTCMLLHNVLRILAAGDCEIVIATDNVGPFVNAAKDMLHAFGVQPNPGES